MNQLGCSLEIQFVGWTPVSGIRFRNLGWGLRICVFNKHPQVIMMPVIPLPYFEKHWNGGYDI